MKKSSEQRLRIAIQKSGRLNQDSIDLLARCGLKLRVGKDALFCHGENLPIDLLLVRDDDIPALVMEQVADLGIVGENVLHEFSLQPEAQPLEVVKSLGFGRCHLSLAVPESFDYKGLDCFDGTTIATSYPQLLKSYLKRQQIDAEVVHLSGSVEVAPHLDMADAICDLVSSGATLIANGLEEVQVIMHSEAVLVQTACTLSMEKQRTLELLLRRMSGVIQANDSKYIMFHAPRSAMEKIQALLPGSEAPTVLPLEDMPNKVAVHVVTHEGVFWETLEDLKLAGASSILVLPIEKMLA